MAKPIKGNRFTHKKFMDPARPHDRSARAVMRITSVSRGNVYYTYADSEDNKGAFYLPIDDWTETYGA